MPALDMEAANQVAAEGAERRLLADLAQLEGTVGAQPVVASVDGDVRWHVEANAAVVVLVVLPVLESRYRRLLPEAGRARLRLCQTAPPTPAHRAVQPSPSCGTSTAFTISGHPSPWWGTASTTHGRRGR